MTDELDPILVRAVAELRRPLEFRADYDERLMAVVRAAPRPGSFAALWAALRRPRAVEVSPLGALALAAGLAAVVLGTAIVSSRPGLPGSGAAAARGGWGGGEARDRSDARPVQFVLVMPSARSVVVVGDFNDWDAGAQPLQRASRDGVWSVTVPLAPGRYRYTFVVDGQRWIADPGAPPVPEDDFGRPNSVITVGENGS